MKIHEKLKKFSESKGETSYSLAKEFEASQQSISNYFNGTNAIPLKFLIWYAEKHEDLDLNALFNKKRVNVIAEEKTGYQTEAKKQDVIDRIVAILEEEL